MVLIATSFPFHMALKTTPNVPLPTAWRKTKRHHNVINCILLLLLYQSCTFVCMYFFGVFLKICNFTCTHFLSLIFAASVLINCENGTGIISAAAAEKKLLVCLWLQESSSWELPVREETLWKTHVLHYLPLPSVGCDLLLHISVLPALVSLYSAVKVAVFLVALKWWLRQCPKLFLFIAGHCVWLLSSFWLWGRWLNICNW